MNVYLNSLPLSQVNRKITEGIRQLTDDKRTLSGTLTRDVIAEKREVQIDWDDLPWSTPVDGGLSVSGLVAQACIASGTACTLEIEREDMSTDTFTMLVDPAGLDINFDGQDAGIYYYSVSIKLTEV